MLKITPQTKRIEKKQVIYHCEFGTSHIFQDHLIQNNQKVCSYRYDQLPGEATERLEIHGDYKPGTSLYATSMLVMDLFELGVGKTGIPYIGYEFSNPPFGSHASCHTFKIDIKYGDADGIHAKRIEFKRSTQGRDQYWMPHNLESWPSMEDIIKFYDGSSNEKIHLYYVCDWIPETRDLEDGKVIIFQSR